MYKIFIASLVGLISIKLTVAAEPVSLIEVEIPSKSELTSIGKIENRKLIDIKPKIKDSIFQLPPGKYIYKINISGSYSLFEGQFELLSEQKRFYIHQQSSPDREIVYVFPSRHEKSTKEYYSQYNELRCASIFNFKLMEKFTQTLTDCEKFANEGSIAIQQIVGKIYADENSDTFNSEKAIKYYRMAYTAGNDEAGNDLAFMYGKKGDSKSAFEIIKKLAAKENPRALVSMAIRYLTGEGVPKNPDLAKGLLLKSAKQGNIFSYRMLSELPIQQNAEKPDLIESLMWAIIYLRASNYGDYSYSVYNSIIGEMSKTQIHDAQQKAETLSNDYKQFHQGRLCVPGKEHLDPKIKGKKLQYRLNQYKEFTNIDNDEKSAGIINIPSNKTENEISFYVDDEFNISKTFYFDNDYLLDKCIVYDKDIDSYDLVNINASEVCDCFNNELREF